MEAASRQEHPVRYKSPQRVQAWFLGKSRDRWKQKYMQLKQQDKRLKAQTAKAQSRCDRWRQEADHLRQRLDQSQAENQHLQARLHEQAKKGDRLTG